MAVGRDRFVVAISGVDLTQVLRDQAGFDSVASDKRQRFGKYVEPPETRELIDHEQQAMTISRHRSAVSKFQVFRKAMKNLTEH